MFPKSFILLATITIAVNSPLVQTTTNETNNGCQDDKSNPICLTPGCIHAASSVIKLMDLSVDPCQDFYKFACGGFLRKTFLADNEPISTYLKLLQNRVNERVRRVLEARQAENEARPIRMVKQYYQQCADVGTIENEGLDAAKTLLANFGGWPVLEGSAWKEDEFDWQITLKKFMSVGRPPVEFVYVSIGPDVRNSTRYIISVDQPPIILPRSILTKDINHEIVTAYQQYLVDVAVTFGADRNLAVKDFRDVIEFMAKIANLTVPEEERHDIASLVNYFTIAELQTKYPGIQWLNFLNNVVTLGNISLTADEEIEIDALIYIEEILKLLERTPKRVQANYLLAKFANDLVPFLNKELRNHKSKFQQTVIGTTSSDPRWKECIEKAASGFKIATSALYVRTYFHQEAKTNAANLIDSLKNSFRKLLTDIDWMDAKTKSKALEKLDAMVVHVAYPSELLENKPMEEHYADLSLGTNFFGSMLKMRAYSMKKNIKMLKDPSPEFDWTKHSDSIAVNAFYSIQENTVSLPAGILQGSVFDDKRPNYMNFGSMGFIIGHEITHGFDDMGRQFNKRGEIEEWWSDETKQKYMDRAKCMIDQYSNYTVPEVNMKLNGMNTIGENIADNGGVKEAYLAYNAWVEKNGQEPRLPGLDFTPNQMFWISSAHVWCTVERKEYLKNMILTNVHSPSYYRVIGSFSNSEHFSNDFKCPIGSRMNPIHKCQIW